jgi:hypothetical protein
LCMQLGLLGLCFRDHKFTPICNILASWKPMQLWQNLCLFQQANATAYTSNHFNYIFVAVYITWEPNINCIPLNWLHQTRYFFTFIRLPGIKYILLSSFWVEICWLIDIINLSRINFLSSHKKRKIWEMTNRLAGVWP